MRANVYVHRGTEAGVFLYTHNRGLALPEVVAAALSRGHERWDDEQYLARIIFCEMVRGDELGCLGFGISALVGDGEGCILSVDVADQTVTQRGWNNWPVRPLPFRQFIALYQSRVRGEALF